MAWLSLTQQLRTAPEQQQQQEKQQQHNQAEVPQWHKLNGDLVTLVLRALLDDVKGDAAELRRTWASCAGVCTLWRSTAHYLLVQHQQQASAASITPTGTANSTNSAHQQLVQAALRLPPPPAVRPSIHGASLHSVFWHPLHVLVSQTLPPPPPATPRNPHALHSRGVPPGKELVRCVVLRTRLAGGKSNFTLYGNPDLSLGPRCFLLHAVQTGRFRPKYVLTLSRSHPSQAAFAVLRADRLSRSHYTLTTLDASTRPWLKGWLQTAGYIAPAPPQPAHPPGQYHSRSLPRQHHQQSIGHPHHLADVDEEAVLGGGFGEGPQQRMDVTRRQSAPGSLAVEAIVSPGEGRTAVGTSAGAGSTSTAHGLAGVSDAGGAGAGEPTATGSGGSSALSRWQLDASQQHLRSATCAPSNGDGRQMSGRTISGRSTAAGAAGTSPDAGVAGARRRAVSTSGTGAGASAGAPAAAAVPFWRSLGSWRLLGGGGSSADRGSDALGLEEQQHQQMWGGGEGEAWGEEDALVFSDEDEEEAEEGEEELEVGLTEGATTARPGMRRSGSGAPPPHASSSTPSTRQLRSPPSRRAAAAPAAAGVGPLRVRLARMSPTQFSYGSGLPRRLDLQCLLPAAGHDLKAALAAALLATPDPAAPRPAVMTHSAASAQHATGRPSWLQRVTSLPHARGAAAGTSGSALAALASDSRRQAPTPSRAFSAPLDPQAGLHIPTTTATTTSSSTPRHQVLMSSNPTFSPGPSASAAAPPPAFSPPPPSSSTTGAPVLSPVSSLARRAAALAGALLPASRRLSGDAHGHHLGGDLAATGAHASKLKAQGGHVGDPGVPGVPGAHAAEDGQGGDGDSAAAAAAAAAAGVGNGGEQGPGSGLQSAGLLGGDGVAQAGGEVVQQGGGGNARHPRISSGGSVALQRRYQPPPPSASASAAAAGGAVDGSGGGAGADTDNATVWGRAVRAVLGSVTPRPPALSSSASADAITTSAAVEAQLGAPAEGSGGAAPGTNAPAAAAAGPHQQAEGISGPVHATAEEQDVLEQHEEERTTASCDVPVVLEPPRVNASPSTPSAGPAATHVQSVGVPTLPDEAARGGGTTLSPCSPTTCLSPQGQGGGAGASCSSSSSAASPAGTSTSQLASSAASSPAGAACGPSPAGRAGAVATAATPLPALPTFPATAARAALTPSAGRGVSSEVEPAPLPPPTPPARHAPERQPSSPIPRTPPAPRAAAATASPTSNAGSSRGAGASPAAPGKPPLSVRVGASPRTPGGASAHRQAGTRAGAGSGVVVARPRVVGFQSKQPHWNANLRCWCLNFGGRVRLPSARNFQLCMAHTQPQPHHADHALPVGAAPPLPPPHLPPVAGGVPDGALLIPAPQAGQGGLHPQHQQDALDAAQLQQNDTTRVILQFGKVGDDAFCLDWDLSLMSPAQALAAAITSFHRSWGAL